MAMLLSLKEYIKVVASKFPEYNYNVPLGYGTRIISKSSARHYNYIY